MKVTIVGKEHVSGTGRKSGKAFDNTIAHVTYKKNGVEGQNVESIWLDAKTYPASDIQIGKVYNVDRDSRGYVCAFELVEGR